ncbi:MAG: tetratricopeptide repeat protein [Ignavibacteriae bacterium]|nr:tetratricopeptide repeat protein [Ignavibacteria bacterium]MBI3364175.1 tetratricopeptide repeat protein [Ignavibacteriota bacterium]
MKLNEIQLARILDNARSLVEEDKHLHAMQVYHRLLREEPAFLPAYVGLTSLYAELGQFPAIIRLLKRALEYAPGNGELIFLLGSYHLRMEEYDAALSRFKQLAEKKLPQVHFNMGVAYFYKNNIKNAEEQFRLTMKFDPAFPKINESLGELLIKREAYTEAIDFLKRGIAADPYSAVNHHLLGVAYGRLDDWKSASREFILAVDMDPAEAINWQMCGDALHHLKRHQEAEQYLRKSLELDPNSADTCVTLGHVLVALGDPTGAGEFLKKALTLDSQNARAKDLRWKLQQKSKQHSH